jgi:hypothetical protein
VAPAPALSSFCGSRGIRRRPRAQRAKPVANSWRVRKQRDADGRARGRHSSRSGQRGNCAAQPGGRGEVDVDVQMCVCTIIPSML